MVLAPFVLLPLMGLLTLFYGALFAFNPRAALEAWAPEAVLFTLVLLLSLRPLPATSRWVASLLLAPIANTFVVLGAQVFGLIWPTPELTVLLAWSALLGFLLFGGLMKIVVVGGAMHWSDLWWFFPAAVFTALPGFLAMPEAFVVHKLLWFWCAAGVLFARLFRNSRVSQERDHGLLCAADVLPNSGLQQTPPSRSLGRRS